VVNRIEKSRRDRSEWSNISASDIRKMYSGFLIRHRSKVPCQ
jgi:hypothetical protein